LAAKIKEATNVDAELIKGAGGIFDVKVDDQMVYSKKASGNQFPEEAAVVEAISAI